MPDLQTTDGWGPRGHALDVLSGMPPEARVETALFRFVPTQSGNRASLSEMQATSVFRPPSFRKEMTAPGVRTGCGHQGSKRSEDRS